MSWNDFGMGTPDWETSLVFMEEELTRGHRIFAVARCQRPETRFTLKKLSALFATSQPWVDYSRLDLAGMLAALADPAWRAKLSEFWQTAKFMAMVSVEKGATPETQTLEGRLLVDIAEEQGVSPADVMFDVALADKLQTFFRISGPVNVDETNLERILKSPATVVGVSDGGAHLQTFAGGDYTSYFLEHWVREKGSFTIEEGVAALTSRRRGLPRAHRPRHPRGRQGGRPGRLRPRHGRPDAVAHAGRHPRRRDADDQERPLASPGCSSTDSPWSRTASPPRRSRAACSALPAIDASVDDGGEGVGPWRSPPRGDGLEPLLLDLGR